MILSTRAYLFRSETPETPLAIENWCVFGSDSTCQIVLDPQAGVSPRHARIENKETHYVLRDLKSATGTYVNGLRIEEQVLRDRDIIQIGTQTYTFSKDSQLNAPGIGLSSKNEAWQSQLRVLGNVAQTDFPVLILGPSGTGKEVLADALHMHSRRKTGPCVSVNCSALSETLIESELFGHVKGSFTGAMADRKGAFEAARGGTLFLDEIGDLSYSLQAKLLRALENNEIRPVGADFNVKTDVRIIAATHQNLNEKIQLGQFRLDLYYRLNVITVTPPALSERLEDFEEIFYKFARSYRTRFSFGAIEKMKRHSWPGNIRELKNTVARASALFPKEEIRESHIPMILDSLSTKLEGSNSTALQETTGTTSVIKDLERQLIIKRLLANNGNQRKTASDLGIPKSTLHDRLKTYQIDPRSFMRSKTLSYRNPLPG